MLERLKRRLQAAAPALPGEFVGDPAPAADAAPCRRDFGTSSVLVIDVRSEREFGAAAIAHAMNLPLPQLEHRIRELVADTATPLVLYCASGARSGVACTMLKQLGYANVTNAGGLYAAAAHLQREVRR